MIYLQRYRQAAIYVCGRTSSTGGFPTLTNCCIFWILLNYGYLYWLNQGFHSAHFTQHTQMISGIFLRLFSVKSRQYKKIFDMAYLTLTFRRKWGKVMHLIWLVTCNEKNLKCDCIILKFRMVKEGKVEHNLYISSRLQRWRFQKSSNKKQVLS